MNKKKVLFVFPTDWDGKQLAHCHEQWQAEYEPIMAELTDMECPSELDIVGYIRQLTEQYRGAIDGVTSSSDYPGATVAGAVAMGLGLPGSRPDVIIQCSHKYYSRLRQRESVPDATPSFFLIDPKTPDVVPPGMTFPCFIKPVKGAFSIMAQKISSPEDLKSFLTRPSVADFTSGYVSIFNNLVSELTDLDIGGSFFLAEGFLHGTQVTVEGYAYNGQVEIFGVVDSVMYPGTGSFARFDYPSALRPEVQEEMAHIARTAIEHLNMQNGLFNIEMIYEASRDRIFIIEINPRMCGQFGDLYQKVDGVNSYRIALDLAVGKKPTFQPGNGAYAMATSFALRTFDKVRVRAAPNAQHVAKVESQYDGALIWWECEPGQDLAEFEKVEDGSSYRYAVVNVGGDSRAELREKLAAIERDLAYEFEHKEGV